MGVHERLPFFGGVNAAKGVVENSMVYSKPFLMKRVRSAVFSGITHGKQSNGN